MLRLYFAAGFGRRYWRLGSLGHPSRDLAAANFLCSGGVNWYCSLVLIPTGSRSHDFYRLGENSVKALARDFSISPILGEEADCLLVRSDEYMASLYPAESNHLVSSESLRAGDALFLGAFVAGAHHSSFVSTETDQSPEHELCVGCVAARFYRDQRYAEIKRLFVDEVFRGNAIARALMSAIENGVLAEGINCARLEMGVFQPEAEALYLSMGYRVIPPFGDYLVDPLSQFLEKQLDNG